MKLELTTVSTYFHWCVHFGLRSLVILKSVFTKKRYTFMPPSNKKKSGVSPLVWLCFLGFCFLWSIDVEAYAVQKHCLDQGYGVVVDYSHFTTTLYLTDQTTLDDFLGEA